MIEQPLIKKIKLIKDVEKVKVTNNDNVYNIKVRLGKVDNLKETYNNIENSIKSIVNQDKYQIAIEYRSNEKIDNLFEDLQPSIYQGLAQKQYLWLDEQIEQQSQKQGITSFMAIDEKRIYVELIDQDSYLYSVIDILTTDQL